MVRPSSLECHVNLLGHRIFLGARPHLDLQDPLCSGALAFFTPFFFPQLEVLSYGGVCAPSVCARLTSERKW